MISLDALLSAIQERRRLAEKAQRATDGQPWRTSDGDKRLVAFGEGDATGLVAMTFDDLAPHIAANDPASVLRQVERDERVMERHHGDWPYDPEDGPGDYSWTERCMNCHVPYPCADILDLAASYAIPTEDPA